MTIKEITHSITRAFFYVFFSIAWILCGGIIMLFLSFTTSLALYWMSDTFLGFVGDIIDGLDSDHLAKDELSAFTFLLYPTVVFTSIIIYFIVGPVLYALINSVGDTKNYIEDVYGDLKNGSEEIWYS